MRTSLFTTISRSISKDALRFAMLTSIVSLLSLSACNYAHLKIAGGGTDPNNKSGLPGGNGGPQLISATLIEHSILQSCKDCHSNLISAVDFRANIVDIFAKTDANQMPPASRGYAPLTDCQKAVLHKWNELGKPETSEVDVATLPACAGTNAPPTIPPTNPGPKPDQPTPPVPTDGPAFVDANVIQGYVFNTCVKCHGAGGKDPDLSTVNNIRLSLGDATDEIDANTMPPPKRLPHLTDCQKAILHKWIDIKTPDTSAVEVSSLQACAGEDVPNYKPTASVEPAASAPSAPAEPAPTVPAPTAPAPIPAPVEPAPAQPVQAQPEAGAPQAPTSILNMPVNYQTFLTQILQPKCVTCHSVGSGEFGADEILFVPFSMISSNARRYAGPSSTNRFLKLLTRTDGDEMPPPSTGLSHLTADELAFVAKWIDAGTPEN